MYGRIMPYIKIYSEILGKISTFLRKKIIYMTFSLKIKAETFIFTAVNQNPCLFSGYPFS